MATRAGNVTTFSIEDVIQPIYTGGDVSIDSQAQILATCLGEDAVLTNIQNGSLLARLDGDGESLTALKLTPSASHLITCSRSLSLKIYAIERSNDQSEGLTVTLQRTLKPHATPIVTATIDHTGTLVGTGAADGTVKVLDIRGGFVTHTFRGHAGVISALLFFQVQSPQVDRKQPARNGVDTRKKAESTDSEGPLFRLASGSEDGTIRVWDLTRRKPIANLESHVSVVRALDFSTSKNLLVSASRDKTLTIWDVRTWKIFKVVPVLEVLECAGFVRDGAFVYTAGEGGVLRLWRTELGVEVTEEQAPLEENGIMHALSIPSQDAVLCVNLDQSLNFHSLEPLSSFLSDGVLPALPVIRRISGTHDEIIDLAYVAPDRSLLALATNSEDIRLISLTKSDSRNPSPDSTRYFGADVALLRGHSDIIICLDVDSSRCWLATGAKDNTAKLWRIDHANQSYTCYATFTGHAESIGAISLPKSLHTPDSSVPSGSLSHPPPFLLTGSQDKTIKKWTIPPSSAPVKSPRAAFTRKAHDKDINALALSPTSALLASASQDRTVKIWSTEDGQVQGILRGHKRGVWTVQFAPKDTPPISNEDGSGPAKSNRGLILTGSGDKTVKIWSLADYSCLRTFEGHTNSVLKVLWMPPSSATSATPSTATDPDTDMPDVSSTLQPKRSAHIVSAGGDGLLKLWDPQSGLCTLTLDNHTDRIWALALHPQTNTIVSGGADAVITFWADTTSTTWAAAAAASTARVEQEQELANYERAGDYRSAITLALALDHPGRLLALFTAVVGRRPQEQGSAMGVRAVDDVIAELGDEQLFKLLCRVREWNVNARTAAVAQRVLGVVVRGYSAERLAGLRGRAGKGGGGGGIGDVLEGLRVYTERHLRRMEGLVAESWVVDYLCRAMDEGVGGREVVMSG